MITRRDFNLATVAIGGGALGPRAFAQESWPSRLIKLVVPFPPGGANDVIGRIMADKLSKALSATVVVENKPGAGGTIGAAAVAKSDPDGYTIMIGYIGNLGYAPTIYGALPYDPVASFAAVSMIAKVPNVLVVNPALPIHSVKELIEYTRANPGKMAYSSGGNGTAAHIGMAYLCHETGLSMVHVPYRGTAPSVTDLISGQVQVTMTGWPGSGPFVRAGKLRAIGVSSSTRVPYAPELPTIAETVPGFEAVQWYGIVAPARTPASIVARLNREIGGMLESPELSKHLTNEGALATRSSPEEFQSHIKAEIARWRKVIIDAGIPRAS
ncbi:MAG: tripartite tricarboxylate transporter substrate binding protein [Hyphomicrobiales bacterium]|nr:tripartite tricarboxylate transporter substrate binding protein [Hyphomicrobiales bacterium]